VFFVVPRLVVKLIAAPAARAEEIANKNPPVADIESPSEDEVGQAMSAPNGMEKSPCRGDFDDCLDCPAGRSCQRRSLGEER
jgi:hypothetical protein